MGPSDLESGKHTSRGDFSSSARFSCFSTRGATWHHSEWDGARIGLRFRGRLDVRFGVEDDQESRVKREPCRRFDKRDRVIRVAFWQRLVRVGRAPGGRGGAAGIDTDVCKLSN